MTLGPASVAHVQRTWASVSAIAPHLRPMFRGNMETQGRRLMERIGAPVAKLDRPAALAHVLDALGRRHASYGVHPGHYVLVGGALLGTLADGLGEACTDEVESARAEVYGVLADTMIATAEAVQTP